MPRVPSVWAQGGMRPPKGTKELWRMMGEEKVHNELILKQYGIIAQKLDTTFDLRIKRCSLRRCNFCELYSSFAHAVFRLKKVMRYFLNTK